MDTEIRKAGIRENFRGYIVDDSRYDYEPVPSKWLWEDIGNYYGAGVYGLSVFDNTYEIHLKTSVFRNSSTNNRHSTRRFVS
jgi:D-alanyl-D-alanine carboxypeptidase/D-alanyl-D-alanine-endopeptidase (penicillin-binding protein 4)